MGYEWQLEEFHNRSVIKCELKYEYVDMTQDGERSKTLFRIFQ